jgi:hypothetical protein
MAVGSGREKQMGESANLKMTVMILESTGETSDSHSVGRVQRDHDGRKGVTVSESWR